MKHVSQFPMKAWTQNGTQTASSRIWNRLPDAIFHDAEHYSTVQRQSEKHAIIFPPSE